MSYEEAYDHDITKICDGLNSSGPKLFSEVQKVLLALGCDYQPFTMCILNGQKSWVTPLIYVFYAIKLREKLNKI